MKMNMLSRVTIVVLCYALTALPAVAKTWHVPGDAATIKLGIGLASSGDTVLVACGTYYENDIRMKSGVRLRSATGDASCVTIDGQQQNRVLYCRFVASTARIEGFTITGGLAPTSASDQGNGGGLYCFDNSSPRITNCIFTDNSTSNVGGGVYCAVNSSPSFVNCTVSHNTSAYGGSGMCFIDNANPTMTDCTVSDNVGEGIWAGNASSPTFLNCTFSGNTYSAITCGYNAGSLTVTDCEFSSNSGIRGAGMRMWNATATLTRCTFSDNAASNAGGALYLIDASATLIDCSISGNTAGDGGGIFLEDSAAGASHLTTDKTVFSGNTADEGANGVVGTGSEAILICSVSDLGGFAGGGTITLNNEGCFTPTKPVTWGQVKALYR